MQLHVVDAVDSSRSGMLTIRANFLLLLLFGPCCCQGLIATPSQQHQRQNRRCATEGGISQSPRESGSSSSSNSLLEQIRKQATVWADTADVGTVERLARSLGLDDVTTNPSIVSATARREDGAAGGTDLRLQTHIKPGTATALGDHERIAVDLGRRLLDIVPGRVCTQLDIRCKDAGEMVAKAHDLVAAYKKMGVPQERVLIKTPATWEGIRATERLEQEGIKCLVTLVCSQVQGRAAAEAGASLIATYVGRVSDWHKTAATNKGAATANASKDPGVVLTADLKEYFVAHGFSTEVMAASFRNADQVAALAACDHLTIAPGLLEELATLPPRDSLPGMISRDASEVLRTPSARSTEEADAVTPARLGETTFHAALRRDVCGTDVLISSIEGFTRDTLALEDAIAKAKQ